MQKLTDVQSEIVNAYNKFVKKYNRHPKRSDMIKLGYSNTKIRRHFTSLTNLRKLVKTTYPKTFEKVFDESIFTKKNFERLKSEVSKYKRFVVTTAVNGCDVNKKFLKSIETYCKENDAVLLILPSNDPAHNLDNSYSWNFDPIIANYLIVFGDIALNSNLFLSSIRLSAKQIDPITGLARIGQKQGSFIYASPKQRLKYVPVGNGKYPRALMTTGALTSPNYKTNRFMSERMAYISENDHVLGAVIVEIENDQFFHFRQIQASNSGAFFDLDKKYDGEKVTKSSPEAIVLGDLHVGETDPQVLEVWKQAVKYLKPKTIVLHDIFSCASCSHHDNNKIITKALKASEGKLNLEDELKQVAEVLNEIGKWTDNILIVKSNHDEHLERYLQEGRYLQEPHNHLMGIELAKAMLEGNDPLKWGVENKGKLQNAEKFVWLKRDEDYEICGVQVGSHGDFGNAGAKGSIKTMEASYGNCIFGHSHSAEVLRGAWQVGTSTFLKLGYNKGVSAWVHASCLLHSNGSRQLINVVNEKWKA